MANARLLHTATKLPDGRVIATGGYNRSAELYDPVSGTWNRTADALDTHTSATATLLQSGQVLVAGLGGNGVSAEVYDATTGTWALTGAMKTPRIHHTATLMQDGRVLVVGGAGHEYGGTVLANAEVYDPATGTWTETGSIGAPRRNHTATLLPSGKVLITGGSDAHNVLQNSAELYDPATGAWNPVGVMSVARAYHTATLLPAGQVLVTGGGGADQYKSASAEVFEPATGTWKMTGRMTKPRRYHTATLLPTRQVLVSGGFHEYTGILRPAELYDPATGTWRSAGSMAVDRYFHTATLLTGGRVLLTGGVSNTDQASSEFYTPFFTPEPGAPEGEPIEPTGTSLLVQVVNRSRAPLPGATVSVAGLERTTDSGGNALFEGLAAGSVLAQVRAPGFAPGTVAAELEPGVHGGATATLAPLNPPIPFNADEDAHIVTEQIQVRIPAGSLVDDNGLPVTGNAEIVFAPIDPTTDDLESSPGPLVGIASADGEEVGLDSGFMAEISLMQDGRQLQLAPGARAAITYTLPPDFAATKVPGDLIPAWWFDLEAGVWREDGIGVVTESPTEPGKLLWTAEVSHFTPWNCDEPWRTQSCANVLVTDLAGRPLAGRSISAHGLSYRYSYSTVTKSNGRVCLPVMRDGRVQITLGSPSAPLDSAVIRPTGNGRCGSSACTSVTLRYSTCGAPGTIQTCAYTGPTGTNGVGTCKAGYRVCDGYTWGACVGQVTPSAEVCGNTTDENCNGRVNDGCPPPPVCSSGSTRACYSGPAGTNGVGICKAGTETCVGGRWSGVCTGQILPAPKEICTNTLDDDCDRMTNEGCGECTPGDTRSCYNGSAGTSGVGVCKAGTQTCYAGSSLPFWGACMGEVKPGSEVCDARDNDCDGSIDESNPGGGASCSTGKPGVCSVGTTTCSDGALVCTATTSPSAEICDGRDNDCDGPVDEGNPGSGASCSTGKPGVCSAGTTTCSSGALVCNPTTLPSAEICDGRDNDCDGPVDEGNPGGGAYCPTGQPGVCSAGTTTCSSGALLCTPNTSPSAETCDGRDNNCNGSVDEDNPGGGASCSTGKPGVCSVGTTTCSDGALVCTATTSPSAEICDGRDNDCDGLVDEDNPGGGASCSTGKPGVCSVGTTTCSDGALVCTATTSPSAEICDGLDNDCNSKVDEGNPGGGASCTTDQPGVCSVGTTTCSGGALVCTAKTAPSPEVCDDRVDNDCDGKTDECITSWFPYETSNTDSATRNTVNQEVTLSAGQTITIGTCNMTGAEASGDTYLRLFNSSGTQVAYSDDYAPCGTSSYFTYTVPPGGTGTYIIKAGCFIMGGCGGKVVYSYSE